MSGNEPQSRIVMNCMVCRQHFPQGTTACPVDGSKLVAGQLDPLIGTTFADRYEIIDVIGRGGMSVVYKAMQKFMKHHVAIKILHNELNSDPTNFERFQLEAKAAVSIKHQNVIQVVDFGVTSGNLAFLIMEYLEGTTLGDFLDNKGSMSVERAVNIFLQACDGLSEAHKQGVIHRDLKPGNLVLITEPDGHEVVKIVDFGIAKMMPLDGSLPQQLTATGEVFGSPLYMSPEQCQGKRLDPRSDIYALGCVMYETLTGVPPLMGINSFETMNKHVHDQPKSMKAVAPEAKIPDTIDEVVMRSLKKDPAKRQQTMIEFKINLLDAAQKENLYLRQFDPLTTQPITSAQSISSGANSAGSTDGTANGAAGNPGAGGSSAGRSGSAANIGPQSKDLQKLVKDAMFVSNTQQEKARKLQGTNKALWAILGTLAVCFIFLMLVPGPQYDRVPFLFKLPFLWDMKRGDSALQQKDFSTAEKFYREAAEKSKSFGPGNERRIASLVALMKVLQLEKAPAETMSVVKHNLLQASLKHMDLVYGTGNSDLASVTDLDDGLLSSMDVTKLDSQECDEYSEDAVKNAKVAFKAGLYKKAISWLEEALDMEEHAHLKGKYVPTKKFAEKPGSPEARTHVDEIEDLLKQAQSAEVEKEKNSPAN